MVGLESIPAHKGRPSHPRRWGRWGVGWEWGEEGLEPGGRAEEQEE